MDPVRTEEVNDFMGSGGGNDDYDTMLAHFVKDMTESSVDEHMLHTLIHMKAPPTVDCITTVARHTAEDVDKNDADDALPFNVDESIFDHNHHVEVGFPRFPARSVSVDEYKDSTNQVKADEPDNKERIVSTKTKEADDESIFDRNCVAGDDASKEKAKAEHHHVSAVAGRTVTKWDDKWLQHFRDLQVSVL